MDVHVHTQHGWSVGRELQDMLEEHGVQGEFTGFAHDVTHTVITIASALGGTAGIAGALKIFVDRHRHRKVAMKVGDREVAIEGFSVKDTRRLLNDMMGDENQSS